MKLVFFIVFYFISEICFASSDTHNQINWWGLGSHYKDAPAIGWLILTFLIFMGILIKFIKKPLADFLALRSEEIKKHIEESRLEKIKSEEKLKAYELKIAALESEIALMKNNFLDLAKKEKEEMLKKSTLLANKMQTELENSIKASFDRSKNNLALQVMDMAIEKAREQIALKNSEFDEHFKNNFIDQIKKAKEISL